VHFILKQTYSRRPDSRSVHREQSHGNSYRGSIPRERTLWTVKWAAIRSELLAQLDGRGKEKTGGKRPVGPTRSSPFSLNWCSIGCTWCLGV